MRAMARTVPRVACGSRDIRAIDPPREFGQSVSQVPPSRNGAEGEKYPFCPVFQTLVGQEQSCCIHVSSRIKEGSCSNKKKILLHGLYDHVVRGGLLGMSNRMISSSSAMSRGNNWCRNRLSLEKNEKKMRFSSSYQEMSSKKGRHSPLSRRKCYPALGTNFSLKGTIPGRGSAEWGVPTTTLAGSEGDVTSDFDRKDPNCNGIHPTRTSER